MGPSHFLQHLSQLWTRWVWSLLAGAFGLLCLAVGWSASAGTSSRVTMAFLLFSLSFFLYGFFSYFFAVANFSAAHRVAERRVLRKPPARLSVVMVYAVIGVASIAGLVLLWMWRTM